MWKYFLSNCKKYQKLKTKYLLLSPKDKWIFIRDIGIFFLKYSGTAFLDPNFKIWWYSYIGTISFFDFYLSFLYTLWYYVDMPVKGLFPISLIGIIVPVCTFSLLIVMTDFKFFPNELYFFSLL